MNNTKLQIFLFFLFLVVSGFLFGQKQDIHPVFQTGHNSKINKLRFHKDNLHIVSIGDDGKLIVWNHKIGLQRKSVIAHNQGVKDFDFINDSSLVTVGGDSCLKVWSFPDLELIKEVHSLPEKVYCVSSVKDSLFALGGQFIHFYNRKSGYLQTIDYRSKEVFTTIDYNEKLRILAIGGKSENNVVTISVDKPYAITKIFHDKSNRVRFADTYLLLEANIDGVVSYNNFKSNKSYSYALDDDLNFVSDVAYSNNIIALGTAYGYARIIDIEKHSTVANYAVDGVGISSVDFSSNGELFSFADLQGNIYLFDTSTKQLTTVFSAAAPAINVLEVIDKELFVGYNNGIIRKMNLFSNQIISNSFKLSDKEKSEGINYSILSIDSLVGKSLWFEVIKSDRHNIHTSRLSSAERLSCKWNLDENLITIVRKIKDKQIKKYVDSLFYSNGSYQVEYLLHNQYKCSLLNNEFTIEPGSLVIHDKLHGELDQMHEAPISGLAVIDELGLLLSYGQDGSIRLWNPAGEYLASLFLSDQYDFIYMDKESYYFASKEILSRVGFLFSNKLYSYEQFDLFYNRPDLVMKKLPFMQPQEIATLKRAYYKRLKKLDIDTSSFKILENLPHISVEYKGEYSTTEDSIVLKIQCKDPENNLSAYVCGVNGQETVYKLK